MQLSSLCSAPSHARACAYTRSRNWSMSACLQTALPVLLWRSGSMRVCGEFFLLGVHASVSVLRGSKRLSSSAHGSAAELSDSAVSGRGKLSLSSCLSTCTCRDLYVFCTDLRLVCGWMLSVGSPAEQYEVLRLKGTERPGSGGRREERAEGGGQRLFLFLTQTGLAHSGSLQERCMPAVHTLKEAHLRGARSSRFPRRVRAKRQDRGKDGSLSPYLLCGPPQGADMHIYLVRTVRRLDHETFPGT